MSGLGGTGYESEPLPLRRATARDIRDQLGQLAVFGGWNDHLWDPGDPALAVSRISMEVAPELGGRGPGGSLMHQGGACYLPGRINFLKGGTDPHFTQFMLDHGMVTEVVLVDGPSSMYRVLRERGLRLYGTDDYGAEFDGLTVCSREAFNRVNEKTRLGDYLPGRFVPVQEVVGLFSPVNPRIVWELSKGGTVDVFVKSNNGEHGNTGVFRVRCGDFDQMVQQIEEIFGRYRTTVQKINHMVDDLSASSLRRLRRLSDQMVLQRSMDGQGTNCGFSLFLPADRSEVLVVSMTEQITNPGDDRKLYSRNARIGDASSLPIAELIRSLAEGVWRLHPDAFGFLKCDFWLNDDGSWTAFDLGLRPSGNTPTAVVRMRIEEEAGFTPVLHSDYLVSTGNAGLPFSGWIEALGQLMDPSVVYKTGYGVLPRGYNPIQGQARLILSAPDDASFGELEAEVLRRLREAFGTAIHV